MNNAEEGANCHFWQLDCMGAEMATSLVGDAVDKLATSVLEAVGSIVGAMATSWIYVGTIDLTSPTGIEGGIANGETPTAGSSHASSSNLETLLGYATWISLGICVLALIFLGAVLALNARRGEAAGVMTKLGIVLFATVLISGASGIVTGVLPATGPQDSARPVAFLQSHLWWYMGAAAVLSVIVGAVRMAWEQRAEPGKELVRSLMTLVVVAGAGVTGIGLAVGAADGFAVWIIEESTDAEFGEAMMEMLTFVITDESGITAFLAIFIGTFVIFFSSLQILLMLIRVGMLVMLAGVFPLAASFTNTEMGKTWFKKFLGWLIAFILYKPAAAIIYAAAFQLVGSSAFAEDSSGLLSLLVGVAMLLISLVAMPALMKFIAPAASLGGGGVGGAMAGAAGLVGGEMASGAMKLGQDQAATGTASAPTQAPSGATETGPTGGGGSGDSDSTQPPEQEETAPSTNPTGGTDGDTPSGSGSSPMETTGDTPSGSGSSPMETTGGTEMAGGAEAAGGAAAPAMVVAERFDDAREGFQNDTNETMTDATRGPDGS
ncbi:MULTISPECIES: hypothetical protein [unclassified Nocardiopsis]|uniref:hypothetical protein n=1 Tax=unclassified Nocardiopsis TaxID=2649073 RepID=UPI00135A4C22|nr:MULTISPECIES: hypothetical protein [unclassified Nocardiopsis]